MPPSAQIHTVRFNVPFIRLPFRCRRSSPFSYEVILSDYAPADAACQCISLFSMNARRAMRKKAGNRKFSAAHEPYLHEAALRHGAAPPHRGAERSGLSGRDADSMQSVMPSPPPHAAPAKPAASPYGRKKSWLISWPRTADKGKQTKRNRYHHRFLFVAQNL